MSDLSQRIADLSPEKRALLARHMRRQEPQAQRPPLLRLPRTTNVFPLSFAQERYWFLHQWDPTSPLYTIAYAVRLRGALDPATVQASTAALVARHEALRTTFAIVDGVPQQVIAAQGHCAVEHVDLRACPASDREQRMSAIASAKINTPFDLEQGPLFRMLLIQLDDAEHVLVCMLHHIIFDGWSAGVLIREVSAHMLALAGAGAAPALPELPVQYVDYAVWQREWLQGAVLERQLNYWRTQLGGPLPILDLPTDRPYPAVDAPAGARLELLLQPELVVGLAKLTQQEGATLFMLLLAAWYVLLQRYSRQDDILVGTPIANRSLAATEPMIGCIANTLVLRARLRGDMAFRELLAQVRQTTLAAYEHQDVPFATVVADLQPERDLHHSPLFQTMFVLQNDAIKTLSTSGLEVAPLLLHTGTAKFALTLEAAQIEQDVRLALEYKTALFDAPTVQRMLEHYQTLLESIIADPAEQIGRLALLRPAERTALLAAQQAAALPISVADCVHERFTAQALRQPEAIALTYDGVRLSYGELNARANQLAHYLNHHGVGPDSLVGLYCGIGVELIVAMLGVLKAGAAYVPIDAGYPQERVAFILADAGISVLLSQAQLAVTLAAQVPLVINLDSDWPQIAQEPATAPPSLAKPANLAYVIYTSGSTGRPKGALITHANVSRLFRATEHWFRFSDQDVWTLFHSCAFDFSVWEIWGALVHGGRLVIVPYLVSRAPAAFYELLCAEGVTVLNQTPSAFRQLMQVEQEREAAELALRYVIFGGEALNLASLRPWFERHGDQRPQLINMYGITETTVHVTYRPLTSADARAAQGSLIGQPIPDLALYVLDAHLQPVPVGVPGELFVGGAGLARGYLNRPELTAERFIQSPFASAPSERLYRTGDLVRWRPTMELEYLGRIDTQVKLRGFRIELGEIESVLVQHAAVRAAVVTVQEEPSGNQRLLAYLVVDPAQVPTFGALRRYLKKALPEYMLPAAFIVLDAIPLTSNGKVDYRALPSQTGGAAVAVDAGATAPATPIEGLIAEIWADTLSLSQVGVEANFFELGGHSLLATQVISRLLERLQVQIALRDFFAAPTVRGLAAVVERERRSAPAAAAPPIVAMPRAQTMPLSFAQQRLWFLHQLEPESAFYNVPVVWRFRGELSVPTLELCLSEIVRRHEVLRTRFINDPLSDGVIQQISAQTAVALTVIDVDQQAADDVLWAYASQEVQRPFDLTCDLLLRAVLLRHGAQDHVLVLTIHHIAFDEWSQGILFHELTTLYAGVMQGAAVDTLLPALPVQYADYAFWHRYWLQGEVLERQLAYWQAQLRGPLAELAVPTDYVRPATQTFNGAHMQCAIPSALYTQLLDLARSADATLFMLLLAAWSTLLGRYSEQDEVLIGTPIANRTRVEIEQLIGFFANTLVLRTDLSGNPSFRELLRRSRELALDAYANQEVPLDQLVSMLQPNRSSSRSPLFQTMLVLQNATREQLNLPGCVVTPVSIENYGARFELSLVLYEQQEQVVGWLEYNTDLFSAETAARMLRHFELLLRRAVADPDQPIRQIPLLSADEQRQLLVQWNAADDAYDLD